MHHPVSNTKATKSSMGSRCFFISRIPSHRRFAIGLLHGRPGVPAPKLSASPMAAAFICAGDHRAFSFPKTAIQQGVRK